MQVRHCEAHGIVMETREYVSMFSEWKIDNSNSR